MTQRIDRFLELLSILPALAAGGSAERLARQLETRDARVGLNDERLARLHQGALELTQLYGAMTPHERTQLLDHPRARAFLVRVQFERVVTLLEQASRK